MYIAETGIIVGTRDSTKTMWSSWLEWIPWRTNFRTVWRQPMMASGTPHMHSKYVFHIPNPHILYIWWKVCPNSTFVVYMSYFLFDKQYLPRFEKLSEVMPVGILAEKYLRMINTFSQEMDRITRQDPTFYCYYSWRSYHSYMPPYYFRFFKKQVVKPPIPRNYPDSSGKIAWARSLLQHLKYFMEHFQKQKTLRHRPEYQHLVKQYNETGKKLLD